MLHSDSGKEMAAVFKLLQTERKHRKPALIASNSSWLCSVIDAKKNGAGKKGRQENKKIPGKSDALEIRPLASDLELM